MRDQKNYFENRLSDRLKEERVRSEQEYKREIEKILVEVNILKNLYKDNTDFNDSGILNNEA